MLHLPYRPKHLPRVDAAESTPQIDRARVRRRLGLATRTAFAPEPFCAPAALHGDGGRIYLPGPVLVVSDGVCLFRDGAPASWPKGREPVAPRAVPPPAWSLWLQGALLIGAIVLGGVIGVDLPQ